MYNGKSAGVGSTFDYKAIPLLLHYLATMLHQMLKRRIYYYLDFIATIFLQFFFFFFFQINCLVSDDKKKFNGTYQVYACY